MKLLLKIGVGISIGINLFIFTALLYNINRYDKRVDENRKWLKETIEKEVYDQIKFVMPKESGGVGGGSTGGGGVSCVTNNCSGV